MKKILMNKLLLLPMFLFLAAFASASTAFAENMQEIRDTKQALMAGKLVVKGEATADQTLPVGQRKLMAMRGAKVIALREIAEVIDGVVVSGESTVANMSAQSDIVRSSVQGLVKGAQIVKEDYDQLSGIATVWVAVSMRGVDGLLPSLLPQAIQALPTAPSYQPTPEQARVAVVNYDGLILDVREQAFRPALINRVLSQSGDVVYDPAKVAQNILVERGAAEYTNDVGKAKALLSERGSTNPVVIKASGLVKSTDVQIGKDDATAIYASNQAKNFLEGAKVVFVLK
ncbi:MAG: LPP20 family lipoprotein [Deltaproteobacteria bacterium]|nr:LPP20 family lipoprotein [Deltaproteobacteria bacterium]